MTSNEQALFGMMQDLGYSHGLCITALQILSQDRLAVSEMLAYLYEEQPSEEAFIKEIKGIELTRSQILEAYMIFGGIPYYLDMLIKGIPLSKNVDELLFKQGAPLRMEFNFLFRSLFNEAEI